MCQRLVAEPGGSGSSGGMSEHSSLIFADVLRRFADALGEPAVTAVADRVAEPLRVAVHGRAGVGRRTVARALSGSGVTVTAERDAEAVVHVIAEVAKPEDATAVAAGTRPVLAVLNKLDLTGRAACTAATARLRVPIEPMSGLLAVAALENTVDDRLWAALGVLAGIPASLAGAADPGAGPAELSAELWRRLRDTLDMSGIGHAVAAVRRGRSADQLGESLRRVSRIDAVIERLGVIAAPVRYRRLSDAVLRLESLAVSDGRIAAFLTRDDVAASRMAAAMRVVEAAGLPAVGAVDSADGPAEQARRAVHWQRYSEGPVDALHRGCGTDIARGCLRLFAAAGGSAGQPR